MRSNLLMNNGWTSNIDSMLLMTDWDGIPSLISISLFLESQRNLLSISRIASSLLSEYTGPIQSAGSEPSSSGKEDVDDERPSLNAMNAWNRISSSHPSEVSEKRDISPEESISALTLIDSPP